ncbi:Mfa1 family fimbria major subunit [Parabacteroides sp. APC149_11_2_Y6]
MKLNYFYGVLPLALILSGCTSNDEEEINGQQPVSKRDAYTSVTIKLPAVSGTRADTGPAHDDGDPKEYAVKDLTLLFFRAPGGVEENEGDFVLSEFLTTLPALQVLPGGGALNVNLPSGTADVTGEITQSFSTEAVPIDKTSSRVLALLNLKGASASLSSELGSILRVGNTFKNINSAIKLVSISDLAGDNGFLMLSEPVWDNTSGKAVTLTKFTPGSKENATANKTYINVERVVAKVSLAVNDVSYTQQDGDMYSSFKISEGSHTGDKIEILGWLLGNTNTYVYPFRKIDNGWSTGFSSVWNNGIYLGKHLYWAEDPNYKEGEGNTSQFNSPVLETATWNNFTVGTAIPSSGVYSEYCLENTCNYNIMYKANVTRIIIKAKYYPNATNQSGGNNTFDMTDGTWWSFTSVAAHYSQKNLFKQIAQWVTDQKIADFPQDLEGDNNIDAAEDGNGIVISSQSNGISATLTSTNGSWSITLEKSRTNHYNLYALSYTPKNGAKVTMGDALKTTFQNQKGEIQKYDQGICYYEAFIRHFTNDEGGYDTTWSIGNDGYGVQQLGRYGVVRNNWYKLTLNSVKQPGEPTIPDDKEVPVDTETAYIDCDVSIVAWALREHGIDL